VISASLARWLTDKGFDLIDIPADDAFTLGVNAVSLGDDRVISAGGATQLNDALRARGIDVLTPDLETFTLGGGGAHCLGQALSRELLAD
jgi:N-dimethylarginine dimethylaminohydrolase